ncbi:tetratricopeptide repeat protein [Azotobacter salinestris]|uniref:tetratricopeptide repeat protein n=1 Tax=Azotobacter salinestris TaxID=69964 RepID=UPI0032DFD9B9
MSIRIIRLLPVLPSFGRRFLAALGTALALGIAPSALAQAEGTAVPLYDNLGNHHYGITTGVPLAQRYFDQGLRLYYAFNHQEATRAFEQAARLDPQCAMCYWGIALAQGPNINAPMDASAGADAHAAIQKALERKASPKEQALIRALATRYASPPPDERAALDEAYARAMREVVRQYPEDQEAATLFAESLMDLSPWQYWTQDGQPRPNTPELIAQLERVIAANPDHPGACHFFIHAVEAAQPERAVPCAERLAGLMPGAGHLVHMPGHIYIRVGRYEDAIKANEHAVHADETYIRDQNPAFGIYVAGYYPHNYDFLAFAASMIGRSGQALGATQKMAELVPQPMLREPGMTFLQHHQTRQLQMLVRFGRWDEILQAEAPPQDLPHASALWHYARGRALAARGDVPGAEAELAQLRATAQDPRMDSLRLEFNTSGAILKIATEVLAGHIAARKADFPGAIDHLRAAVRLEDGLVYGEPPEWTVPVRQDLGSVLLAAGRNEEAEQAYREDLKRFPENGWSLHGLAQTLRTQNRSQEADAVMERFRKVWAGADMQLAAAAR